jgi:ferredoxin-type protein NapH
LLLDLLVARRGFCRYLCPGGALYSLLGRFRLVRIKRVVEECNDCAKCTSICEFGLDPLRDNFGQECNNCSACIAICPTDAMTFYISPKDLAYQGPGHIGPKYRHGRAKVDSANANSQNPGAQRVGHASS